MEVQSDLNKVFQNIKANNLSGAISGLEIFLSSHPHQVNSDRLHAILTELQLMADYWKRGFKDPPVAESLPEADATDVCALCQYQQAVQYLAVVLPVVAPVEGEIVGT